MHLSEHYRLVFETDNVVLQYFETRERTKKDGTKEMYEFQQNTYHNTVPNALRAYLHKSLVGSKSIEECLERIKSLEQKYDLTNLYAEK
mgnify:FL=1